MAVREGFWNCTHCGTANRGRDMACKSCGKPRDPDVEFYLEEEAAEVQDADLLDTARAGADWTCEFCGTDNRARLSSCRQCGATKGSSPNRESGRVHQIGGAQPGAAQETGSGAPTPGGREAGGKSPKPKFILPLAILGVVALVVAGILLFSQKDIGLEVVSAGWERTIEVEEEQLVRRTAPEDQVPRSARILRTWTEQAGTERVQVGTERVRTGSRDLGNGFFEDVYQDRPVYESRPVYRDMAEFEVWEWVPVRTARSSGTSVEELRWPEPGLRAGQREGARRTLTEALVRDPESAKDYRVRPPEDLLAHYRPGVRFEGKVNGFGVITSIQDQGNEVLSP